MKKILFLICTLSLLTALFASCSDEEANPTFSKREYVFCLFDVHQYAELFNVMGNYGQFASIRKRVVNGVTKFSIANSSSAHDYTVDALSKDFGLGLGGLIVGTNNYGKTLCYDLACPICDRASRRLTLTAGGYARCAKCLVTYDMNNYGAIYKIPQDTTLNKPRGLYRYRVNYNGQILNAYN